MLIQMFVYLQLLDFLTTLLGFRLGASEASPFIRALVHMGPALGVALSKGIALLVGGVCIWLKKERLIGLITYFSAGLVVWNLCVIMRAIQLHG
jgi:Domain of unknown function (DUF5658)